MGHGWWVDRKTLDETDGEDPELEPAADIAAIALADRRLFRARDAPLAHCSAVRKSASELPSYGAFAAVGFGLGTLGEDPLLDLGRLGDGETEA